MKIHISLGAVAASVLKTSERRAESSSTCVWRIWTLFDASVPAGSESGLSPNET